MLFTIYDTNIFVYCNGLSCSVQLHVALLALFYSSCFKFPCFMIQFKYSIKNRKRNIYVNTRYTCCTERKYKWLFSSSFYNHLCFISYSQINLRLILVSGKTKEFLFSPSDSAGDIAQTVFEQWPQGKLSNLITH